MSRYIVLLLFVNLTFGQTYFRGKVVTDVFPTSILIVNNNSKTHVTPDKEGSFIIEANVNDLVVFASEKIEGLTIKLSLSELNKTENIIYLKQKPRELEEVLVKSYPHFNAVSLGIISKDVKEYTKSERKLIAIQNNFSPIGLISRAFSNEVKMIKKEIENEKNEKTRNQILAHFTEEFFSQTLRIPLDNIKGFLIFVLDDSVVSHLLELKNYDAIESILKEKTFQYLERINE